MLGDEAMKLYSRMFRSNRGSSIILVLVVILILTTFGMVSLLLSIGNIKMAGKYKSSSGEYYALENASEGALAYIDKQLEQAQDSALDYMKQEKYNKDDDLDELKHGYNQAFFYENWKENVYTPSQESGLDLNGNTKEVTNSDRYNEKMQDFYDPAFNVLYFNYALKKLDSIEDNVKNNVDAFKNGDFKISIKTDIKKDYGEIGKGKKLEDYKYEEDDVAVVMNVSDSSGRKLTAKLYVKPPLCGSIDNDENIAVQGNPIWANAITAFGNVKFKDVTANIFGDIFASDKSSSGKGIDIANSNVHIRGNVYSNGDFQVSSGNSKVDVSKYNGDVKVDYKSGMYDKDAFGNKNEVFFYRYDNTVVPSIVHINRYTDGKDIRIEEDLPFMPFVYRDIDGGDVYCNNLCINNSAENSKINIENAVWTRENLINDSKGGSDITVNGAYIGISPPGKAAQDGSCIINNIYPGNENVIHLGDKFVAPGRKILVDVNGKKYETLESISSNDWTNDDFLQPYISKDGTGEDYTFNINNKEKTYKLITDSDKKLQSFISYIKDKEASNSSLNLGSVESSISTPEGYVGGAAILKRNNVNVCYGSQDDWYYPESNTSRIKIGKNEIKGTSTNMCTLDEFIRDKVIGNIYNAKTKWLGMYNINLSGLVNKNVLLNEDGTVVPEVDGGIIYLKDADNSFSVEGNRTGIIYAEGNLEIKGNGDFKGAIICTGNVTVSGNVTLHYDEDVIADILNKNKIAKNFFKPGAIGDAVFYEKRKSTNVRAKKIVDKERYELIQWKKN